MLLFDYERAYNRFERFCIYLDVEVIGLHFKDYFISYYSKYNYVFFVVAMRIITTGIICVYQQVFWLFCL